MTQIKNFIPYYPDKNDPNFIGKLSHLKEFAILKANANSTSSDHQVMQSRYINAYSPYNKEVMWHGTGTGKTRGSAIVVENYTSQIQSLKNRFVFSEVYTERSTKKALIFVKNKTIRKNWEKEIEKLYISQREATYSDHLLSIKETYDILTFGKSLSGDKIKLLLLNAENHIYDDRIIIIDEAHEIRKQPSKNDEGSIFYHNLHAFLHHENLVNNRVILLTATPIWDQPYDFAGIFNLILSKDEQLPELKDFMKLAFSRDKKLTSKATELLQERLQGKVSYIRPLESIARFEDVGSTKVGKERVFQHLKVVSVNMSKFQISLIKRLESGGEEKGSNPNAFLQKLKDIATCIYPSDEKNSNFYYTKKDFQDKVIAITEKKIPYSTKNGKKKIRKIHQTKFNNKIYDKLFGPEGNLLAFAPKFHQIIKSLLSEDALHENGFIYNESVWGTGGCMSLALILKLWGFRWITSLEEVKDLSSIGKIKITREDPGRFIVITGTESEKDVTRFIDYFNRDENRYGEYVRFIIGSQTLAQSITLKNIRQEHFVMAMWNMASIDQVTGRTYRLGSHDALTLKERYVKCYKHVAVNPKSVMDSPDIHIYSLAEDKELLNVQLYRLLKRIAWDCELAKGRNLLKKDKDGSRICDFQKCEYQCFQYDIKDMTEDPTNYNLLYAEDTVQSYISKIKELFSNYTVLRFESIVKLLLVPKDEIPILLNALQNIITLKYQITDISGRLSHLNERYNSYFLSLSEAGNLVEWTYQKYPLFCEQIPIEESVEIFLLDQAVPDIKKFIKEPVESNFDRLSYRIKILLLENTFLHRETQQCNVVKVIQNTFGESIHKTKDGNFVHILYGQEDKGVGYYTNEKAGTMRIFNSTLGEWQFLNNAVMETLYMMQIKNKVKKTEKVKTIDAPIYGLYDKKFKIVNKIAMGNKAKGQACSSYNRTALIALMHQLQFIPKWKDDESSTTKYSKNELLTLIPKFTLFQNSPFANESLENYKLDQLRSLYEIFSMSVTTGKICNQIEQWLKSQNLYVEA